MILGFEKNWCKYVKDIHVSTNIELQNIIGLFILLFLLQNKNKYLKFLFNNKIFIKYTIRD